MSKKSDDIKKMTFEQAYTELEKTLAELEGGNLPLAKSLALYERGMDLARQCNVQLDQAELTIKKLTPAGDLVDFEP
ncbi:MAG: exodeoxyribonuclease VII small subunit [Anaerolineae bacterium]|nr:exodeoxyribonuclease VII small subunit [Anaerolineae bacterium]